MMVTKTDFNKIFLDFLYERGWQTKYLSNLQEQKDVDFSEFAKYFDILEWVSSAFQYDRTPEGIGYWYNVQQEWKKKFYTVIDELETKDIEYDEDVWDSVW